MANRVPFFFYAPTWDFPPDGPIKLGNVLTSFKTPELPLYTAPPPTSDEVFLTEKRQVEFSHEKLREGQFSILTKFLSFLGAGVDLSASRSKSSEETMSFDRLETIQFFPREDYIRTCVEAGAVRRFLEKTRYNKPVYIITGLKVIRGASARTLAGRSVGGSLGVEIDGTFWSGGSVPVSGGPEISATVSRRQGTSWDGSSDFVLAYRVRKVKVSKKGAVRKAEDYTTGAMLGQDAVEIERPELDILVEDLDATEGTEGFVIEEAMDGDEVVVCAVPVNSKGATAQRTE
ncbi:hypothetical protein NEMBOFW57_005677 [Staphylotrichum longicolle]|uniref:Uncharacterized protein n=1 Tax=Staphylotrichum longicolle TaxID=669026 RepID=A0AAD4EY66_9PEZI|nr:hypothetical protein NEMBOFW57_005677 [Staphylotrichum longicolle]